MMGVEGWVGRRIVCGVSSVLVCRSGWVCVMAREVKAMGESAGETGGWESIQFTALVLRRVVWLGCLDCVKQNYWTLSALELAERP